MTRRTVHRVTAAILASLAFAAAQPLHAQPVTKGACDVVIPVLTDWVTFTEQDGLPHRGIRAVRVYGDQVWVGTDNGLALRTSETWKHWTRDDGLPATTVSAIDVHAPTRDVWIGTWGAGLVRFSGGRFDRYAQINSGLAGDIVFDVAVAGDRIWAATNGGLSAFDPNSGDWTLFFPRRAIGPPRIIRDLLKRGPELLAGAWRGGIYRFDPGEARWHPVWPDRTGVQPMNLAFTVGGKSLWSVSPSSVHRWDTAGNWSSVDRVIHGSDSGFVYALGSSGSHQVWLGMENGLATFGYGDDQSWIEYLRDSEGTAGMVRARQVGADLGIRRLTAPPPAGRVRCVTFDSHGVWVGTDQGLSYGSGPRPWETLPKISEPSPLSGGQDRRPADNGKTKRPFPAHPEESPISIALYGPRSRTITLPGQTPGGIGPSDRTDVLAAQIALEQANARGGYRPGDPFGLVTRFVGYEGYGWGLPEDDFVIFSANPSVIGVVGSIGTRDRSAEIVACGSEIPVVSVTPVAEFNDRRDSTPWLFRCLHNEKRRHRAVLDHLIDDLGHQRIAALHMEGAADHDRLTWWSQHAGERGYALVGQIKMGRDAQRLDEALTSLERLRPDAVLTWSGATMTAAVVRRMRERDMSQLVVGGPMILGRRFREAVGEGAGHVMALAPAATGDGIASGGQPSRDPVGEPGSRSSGEAAALAAFAAEYARRNLVGKVHKPPDRHAFITLDAMNHLIAAIREAGPDRNAVRLKLEKMHRSVNGERHYERLHEPVDVKVMRLTDSEWVAHAIQARDSG